MRFGRILQLTVLNLQMKKPICKCRTVIVVEVFDLLVPLIFFLCQECSVNIIYGLVYSLQCIGRLVLDSSYQYRLSGIKSPTFVLQFGYLKLRILLVNEPFSLARSPFLNLNRLL